MKAQIQQLISFIQSKGYATYDEVKDQAEVINFKWRAESWRRDLRNKVKLQNALIEKVMEKGVIVGWRAKKPTQGNFKPNKPTIEPFETSDMLLNDALREVVKILMKDPWNKAREIAMINNAIKGDNTNTKKGLINHYNSNLK